MTRFTVPLVLSSWFALVQSGYCQKIPNATEQERQTNDDPRLRQLPTKDEKKPGVIVLAREGKVPPSKKYLLKDSKLANPRLRIDSTNQADITSAIANAELHVRIDRPKGIRPLFQAGSVQLGC